jgi:hypothetical protein
MQGRLRWVEADLRDASWLTYLKETQVDADILLVKLL